MEWNGSNKGMAGRSLIIMTIGSMKPPSALSPFLRWVCGGCPVRNAVCNCFFNPPRAWKQEAGRSPVAHAVRPGRRKLSPRRTLYDLFGDSSWAKTVLEVRPADDQFGVFGPSPLHRGCLIGTFTAGSRRRCCARYLAVHVDRFAQRRGDRNAWTCWPPNQWRSASEGGQMVCVSGEVQP